MTQQRIGIYAGTFDPVHSGHISFALQALDEAGLDEIYFLAERMPRYKTGVEHYGHRVAMLSQAIRPYMALSLMELADKQFTVGRTLPQFRRLFHGKQVVLLMGADVFVRLPDWSNLEQVIKHLEFVVAIRDKDALNAVLATIQHLHIPSKSITVVDSARPDISSTQIRQAIRYNDSAQGLLSSVARYAQREWLYVGIQ